MRGRTVGGFGRLAAVGGLLLLTGIPATAAQTVDDAFVGYQAQASGTGLTAFPELPALLPVEVPFEATVSLATATLSSGGEGFGRASTFFPGSLTTGLRPLIEIGAGVRLPIPDYPVVVESREYDGARHSDVPGITMSSDVDPDRAVAVAGIASTTVPGFVGVRSIHTESRSELRAGMITATSTTTLNGIDLADTVFIGSLVSVASVSSNGVTSTCSGGVTISDAKVGETPVVIDDAGIHVDRGAPVTPIGAGPALERALAESGIRVTALGGTDECTSATGSRSTAGLLVRIPTPAIGIVPVAGGLNLVLGSTAATAGASSVATEAGFEDAGEEPTFGDVVSRLPGPFTGGGALDPVGTGGVRPGAGPGTAVGDSGFPIDHTAYSYEGLPASLVVGLLLLAVPGSIRLRRYMLRIIRLTGSA